MNDGTTHANSRSVRCYCEARRHVSGRGLLAELRNGRFLQNVSDVMAGFNVFGLFIGIGGVGVFPLHWNACRQPVSVTTRRPVVLISLSGVVEF